jgi:hypothetical protein
LAPVILYLFAPNHVPYIGKVKQVNEVTWCLNPINLSVLEVPVTSEEVVIYSVTVKEANMAQSISLCP